MSSVLDWQWIQKKIQQTKIGCTLYPELRVKKVRRHGARHGKTKE